MILQNTRKVQIPVSVKCRLGVDNLDSAEFSREFVATAAQGGKLSPGSAAASVEQGSVQQCHALYGMDPKTNVDSLLGR